MEDLKMINVEIEVFHLEFLTFLHLILYFSCQLGPVVTPFAGSLTCVGIS